MQPGRPIVTHSDGPPELQVANGQSGFHRSHNPTPEPGGNEAARQFFEEAAPKLRQLRRLSREHPELAELLIRHIDNQVRENRHQD